MCEGSDTQLCITTKNGLSVIINAQYSILKEQVITWLRQAWDKLTNDIIGDAFFSDEDINGQALLQLITDVSEFKEVLTKAGDRLAVKRVVNKLDPV